MSVVEFPQRETAYWVCNCGCMSMFVRDDGQAECANCAAVATTGFYLVMPDGPRHEAAPDDGPLPYSVTFKELGFAQARHLDRIRRGEFAILIGIASGGQINTVSRGCDVETPEQRKWLIRRLREAYRSITR